MLAVQARHPLVLPMSARTRRVRRPFRPSQHGGPYTLPRDVHDRLATALASFRNREAAYALAVFLARFQSVPGKVLDAFPIDRRVLAGHPELGLTEKQVRSAIRTLEAVGYLGRAVASGSTHVMTDEGALHRKPILYRFGKDYGPMFGAANRRAVAARGRRSAASGSQVPETARRASTANFRASAPAASSSPSGRPPNGPKATGESESSVLMGPLVKESGRPPSGFEDNPHVGAALDRLLQGIRQSRGG